MRFKVLAAIAFAGLLLALAPAAAHERVTLDADDSPGPLDVVAARLKHPSGQLKLRVVTYEAWSDPALSGDVNYVRIDIDRPARSGIERCIVVRTDPPSDEGPSGMDGIVYKHCDVPVPYDQKIGTVESVARPDSHALEVSVKRRTLWKTSPEVIRFRAVTSYEEESHPDCPSPDHLPPEHFFGTCVDLTSWRRP